MKITVTAEKPIDDKVAATVTVPAADVDKAIAKTYKDIAKKYNFQGFRRGHAPRPVIDGIIGRESVLAQATNDLLNAVEPMMLEELDVTPVGRVSFGEEGADPQLASQGSDYVITATIGVRPTCELESYDAPEINLPPEEATEAEIDWQINQLLTYQVTYEDVEEDRAAEPGDVVSVDVENVEGAGHLAGKNRLLALDGQQVPEQLQEGIVGMKKGEEKAIEWTHTHVHEGEEHSHTFSVKVTLNGIKKAVTPELDDEVAKKFGFDDVAAFRAAVKEEIEGDKKTTIPNLKEDRVVEAMGKVLKLETVPEAYQNEIFNELASEFLAQLQRQNVSLDMFLRARGLKSDDFIADLRVQAEERARQSLALDAVAAKLGLEATEDDVRAEFERAGVEDVDASVKQWREEGRLPAIRDSIRRTKALDWLVENAKVNVVDEVAERASEGEKDDEASDAE
ncbi:trigger factor [Thermophilibacter provencensis]|uniref:Trigger factor n=1 Tax=Thermophilibacter provencensis TaxID=1852386 RepID=A0A921KLP1_9ACTN|nr:trigger factor [Thermophilibacter provencensis]MBM6815001.1 trigger factor [Olsenella uli]HJF45565.1 trigger factor [Thermophilibacter provencensis]